MFSGKDYVADTAQLQKLTVATPMYQIVEYLTGFNRQNGANVPGMRRMWQTIGQWGWGNTDVEYPMTPERALACHMIRALGEHMAPEFDWVDWTEFGNRKDFWVNILLQRIDQVQLTPGKIGVAMTSCRFNHEIDPLKAAGFDHYLVMCSEETRQERMAAAGYVQKPEEAADTSERLAKELETCMPPYYIIWNDHRPKPDATMLTVAEFVEKINPSI